MSFTKLPQQRDHYFTNKIRDLNCLNRIFATFQLNPQQPLSVAYSGFFFTESADPSRTTRSPDCMAGNPSLGHIRRILCVRCRASAVEVVPAVPRSAGSLGRLVRPRVGCKKWLTCSASVVKWRSQVRYLPHVSFGKSGCMRKDR